MAERQDERRARLAAALRANLKRRKAAGDDPDGKARGAANDRGNEPADVESRTGEPKS